MDAERSAPRSSLLIIIAILVVAGVLGVDHLKRMDGRFFVPSWPGARGFAYYVVGDYRNAAHFYRLDLARHARTVTADETWSWTTMMSGDLDRAAREARAESKRAPEEPAYTLTLAEIALLTDNPSAAIELAEQVLHRQRDDYDALLVTAVARARQARFDDAVDAVKRALRYDRTERRITVFLSVLELTGALERLPSAERPACLLAHLHRYLRIFDPSHAIPAARYAQRAITAGDRPDDAYVTLGVIHTKRGYRRAAFDAFRRAVALNPRNTAALLAAARHHADRGEPAEEYRLTRLAFEAAPRDAFVAASLHGLLMQKLGDYRQARSMAEGAVAANSGDSEAWWRLAHVKSYTGDLRGALEAYQRAAALTPRVAELQMHMGHALAALDRRAEAVAAYKRASVLDPLAPEPHYGVGRIYGKEQRWTDALHEYEVGYALGGRGIDNVVGLCELYWETGQAARADTCLGEVLAREPDNLRGQALLEHVRAGTPRMSMSR